MTFIDKSFSFVDIKSHCMMGLFPEIGRAWLSIDSDIYVRFIKKNGKFLTFLSKLYSFIRFRSGPMKIHAM